MRHGALRSFRGLPQGAFQFGVQFAANRSYLLVAKLPEECGGLVVFKGRASRCVLV